MYIRIQNDSIRYRLSREEAAQLADGKTFQSSLSVSPSFSLKYGIITTLETSRFEYKEDSNELLLCINRNDLLKEIENRPSKKGLIFTQFFDEKSISVALEVDLKKTDKNWQFI